MVFVGILVALGMFLVTYRGYKNKYNLDWIVAIIAGVAAIGVALFPTEAPDGIPNLSWWTPQTGKVHDWCAIVLFAAFIIFSLVLFPKSKVKERKFLRPDKKMRNFFYFLSGATMFLCMIWIIIKRKLYNGDIFWPEAIALEAFAVSWLLKGRADWTLLNGVRRVLHYGRHPGQLARKVWRV